MQKSRMRKSLGWTIHKEAEIKGKIWKGQAKSWKNVHWHCFMEAQCFKNRLHILPSHDVT
jgi:hypothetical protein